MNTKLDCKIISDVADTTNFIEGRLYVDKYYKLKAVVKNPTVAIAKDISSVAFIADKDIPTEIEGTCKRGGGMLSTIEGVDKSYIIITCEWEVD